MFRVWTRDLLAPAPWTKYNAFILEEYSGVNTFDPNNRSFSTFCPSLKFQW